MYEIKQNDILSFLYMYMCTSFRIILRPTSHFISTELQYLSNNALLHTESKITKYRQNFVWKVYDVCNEKNVFCYICFLEGCLLYI